ncbi:MAG TPA: AAA family ATPase, partial [Ignavibacteria bacterium]|nr:AAA family ATPase [Ignavibacteria bacterium]
MLNSNEIYNFIQQGENETLEFKQSFSKVVIETLVAFSNTRGGKVLIGVRNDKSLTGVSATEETVQKWINEIKQNTEPAIIPDAETILIEEKEIVILSVIEYPIKPVSFKNKYFKRVLNSNHLMSLDELSNLHLQTINSSWDYYPDPNHGLEHISTRKIEKYITEYEKWNDTTVDYSPYDFLNKFEILRDNKLTFGAYILFAKDLCVVSDIQIGRFKSPTKIIDSLNLDTDIFTELNSIMTFIKKHLMVEFIITG